MKYLFAIILLMVFNSCFINRFKFAPQKELKKSLNVEFCQLPQFDSSKLCKVRAIFSGVDEYWNLHSNQDCLINYKVNFFYDNESSIKNAINGYFLEKRLRKLHNNYSKYEVEMELIGNFETDFEIGFGHLGTNNYNFNAKKVRILKYLKKRKSIKSK